VRLKNFSLTYGTQIFKAFSEEARVRIIHLLFEQGELTISDLEAVLEFTQTKTSRHIIFLKTSGLLNVRKKDQWVFYSIKEEVYDLVSRMIEFLQKDSLLLKDMESVRIMQSNRELSVNKLAAKEYRR
jgi:ArsR family transcriptional regulator